MSARLIRKEQLKKDPELQALENVAAVVFLEHYFDEFLGQVQRLRRRQDRRHPRQDPVQNVAARPCRGAGAAPARARPRAGRGGDREGIRGARAARRRRDRLSAWTKDASILIVGGGLAGVFCALKLAPSPVTILAPAGHWRAPRPLGAGRRRGGGFGRRHAGGSRRRHDRRRRRTCRRRTSRSASRWKRGRGSTISRPSARPSTATRWACLQPSREAAHTHRRIVRVKGDAAGRAIMETLARRVRETPSIEVVERHFGI